MKNKLYDSREVRLLFNEAVNQADASLWQRIKDEKGSRERLLAMADCLEELTLQIARVMDMEEYDGDINEPKL